MNKALKSISLLQGYIWNIGYRASPWQLRQKEVRHLQFHEFSGFADGDPYPLDRIVQQGPFTCVAWWVACSPALISACVLITNHYQKYELARGLYFTLYPVVTSLIYALRIDAGIEFFLFLYGVLSVFFLQNIYNIIFSFTLSMACYLLVCTVWKDYDFSLEKANYTFYLFNHLLAIFLHLHRSVVDQE